MLHVLLHMFTPCVSSCQDCDLEKPFIGHSRVNMQTLGRCIKLEQENCNIFGLMSTTLVKNVIHRPNVTGHSYKE